MIFNPKDIVVRDGYKVNRKFEEFLNFLCQEATKQDLNWFCDRFDLEPPKIVEMDDGSRGLDKELDIKDWDIEREYPDYFIVTSFDSSEGPVAVLSKFKTNLSGHI